MDGPSPPVFQPTKRSPPGGFGKNTRICCKESFFKHNFAEQAVCNKNERHDLLFAYSIFAKLRSRTGLHPLYEPVFHQYVAGAQHADRHPLRRCSPGGNQKGEKYREVLLIFYCMFETLLKCQARHALFTVNVVQFFTQKNAEFLTLKPKQICWLSTIDLFNFADAFRSCRNQKASAAP